MKKKHFFAVTITAITFIGSITLASCEKEKMNTGITLNDNHVKSSNIPYFETIDDLQRALERATSFDSLSDLIQYETSIGRRSIGAVSDYFYESITPEDFTDSNQALSFYTNNNNLLDTVMINGSIAITPKLFLNPYRYIANEDGLFAIDSYTYKVFKKGIVSTSTENINELVALTEEDLDHLDTTVFFYGGNSSTTIFPHPDCTYQWHLRDSVEIGNNGVYMDLFTMFLPAPGNSIMLNTSIRVYSLHKWSRVWWPTRHTLTCQGDITIHKKLEYCNFEYDPHNIYKQKKALVMWVPVNVDYFITGANPINYHYYSFHLSARTPSLGNATLSFN